MAACELSVEEIYAFFKENNGKVKNRDAVRYFKRYLTDPLSKDENRTKFKQYVNLLAHTKNENGEKVLILKTKYQNTLDAAPSPLASPLGPSEGRYQPLGNMTSPQFDPWNAVGLPTAPLSEINSNVVPPPNYGMPSPIAAQSSPGRQPPPYRHPPPPPMSPSNSSLDNISLGSTSTLSSLASSEPSKSEAPPQAPPRRRDSEKSRNLSVEDLADGRQDVVTTPVSVRERTQKFNRMASTEEETAVKMPKSAEKDRNKSANWGADEQDTSNLPPLEPKKRQEWYVTCSRGDCQELLKLARAEPRLVNKKDPFSAYTVLHWGAKYGNPEIIKIFAGTYKCDVNARTNGGYTPLHISAQFGHKDLFKLLIEVYKADTKIRDYSGRTADYYLLTKEQLKENYGPTIRRIKGRKKQSDKDHGFLRIGSLNVRVKKTTEAFSNFLGVGSSVPINPAETIHEKVHKGWGSADNLLKDPNLTGAKSSSYLSRKKSKRSVESGLTHSTPNTPRTPTRSYSLASTASVTSQNDSDSDSAGFDSNWKN